MREGSESRYGVVQFHISNIIEIIGGSRGRFGYWMREARRSSLIYRSGDQILSLCDQIGESRPHASLGIALSLTPNS